MLAISKEKLREGNEAAAVAAEKWNVEKHGQCECRFFQRGEGRLFNAYMCPNTLPPNVIEHG